MPRKKVISPDGRRTWKRTNPVARGNAQPRRVYLTTGVESVALMQSPIDQRSALGRIYKKRISELQAHLGNDLSVPKQALADQSVRLSILSDLSWGEVMKVDGLIRKDGTPHPSIDIFMKASKHQRDMLGVLGIQRRAKDVTLQDVLNGTAKQEAS